MSKNLPDKYLSNNVSDYKLARSQLLLPEDIKLDEENLNLSCHHFITTASFWAFQKKKMYFNKCLLNE